MELTALLPGSISMSSTSYNIKRPCMIFLYFVLLITGAWGQCNRPENLPFAQITQDNLNKDSFPSGTTVLYECRPGYTRVPGTKSSIVCLDDNTWSQPDTFCQRRSCGNPGDLLNGEMEAEDFNFGSKVIYKCNEGYRLTSKRNYRECQADGQWSNVLPQCEAVICPAPDTPPNGSFDPSKDEYSYLDAVTFSCNRGLVISGATSVSCTADGTWSSGSPTCVAVECSDPVVPHSTRLSGFGGPYNLNYAVRFECLAGYVMNGSSSITCRINSQWEPEVPKCLTVCNPPPTFPYMKPDETFAHLPNYFSGTTVQYNCEPGYERDPNKVITITCSGRSWSKPDQFCTRISCGDPGDIMNAERSAPDFLFGSKATYTCLEGYAKSSEISYRECQEDGTWSTSDIVCTAVCNPPPTFSYMKPDAHLPNYFSGTTVRYNCEPGYERDLNKDNTITCSGRSWSKPDQFCTPVSCGNPGEVTNARMSATNFLFGTSAIYTCEDGYVMKSNINYRVCQADRTWSRADLVCAVVCNPPPTFPNAELDEKSAKLPNYFDGTTVQYNCKHGYQRDPNKENTITCSGKSWSTLEQFCTTKSNAPIIIGNPSQILLMCGILIVMHKYI
ncbi:C4b-binding protein alpha chain-like isoform X2 [Mixophyes fleayi]|uniref:C4b-binding protein alpha chain-like isoform X2 n=1 Tax=Mixophyes fleayi TaxID=3061075 RepID=UPI003F4E3834